MSTANDKWSFFPAETADPVGKYTQPKEYTDTMGENGYPNAVANTQTMKTRGTGAATKGTNNSKKMG
jgi:hypothetical protein